MPSLGTRRGQTDPSVRASQEAFADELLLRFGEEGLLDDDDLDDDEDDLEDDLDEVEGFGGEAAWPSRIRSADLSRQGMSHGLGAGIGRTVGSSAGLAANVAQGLAASGYNPWAPPPSVVLDVPLAPVADRNTLPPVYVVDKVLATEAKNAPSVTSPATVSPTTRFGASFHEGSVRPRSGNDREAILRARFGSAKELREAVPGPSSPLVEDGGASPLLLSDGTISDPVHGRLSLLSCFSCSGLPAARYGASGNGCVVCDDYGAILVPASDLPTVAGTTRYGFIAALISAITPLAGTAAQLGGGAVGAQKASHAQEASARASKVYDRLRKEIEVPPPSATTATAEEHVSGLGGDLGGLDDLEDLDGEEDEDVFDTSGSLDDSFGEDGVDDDDLDFLEDGDPFPEDDEDEDDLRAEGRIVRVLFPQGRV